MVGKFEKYLNIKMWFKNEEKGIPIEAQQLTNPTSIHEDAGLIPGLTQWINDLALQWAVL